MIHKVFFSRYYWRWDYRFGDERKTMALGVYPEVGLAKAHADRHKARKLLASGNDPMADRNIDKLVRVSAAANSFKSVAVEWHTGQSVRWAPITVMKALKHMEAGLFPPVLGHRQVFEITPPELLAALRRVQARGATYTATRLREICGQVRSSATRSPRGAPRTTRRRTSWEPSCCPTGCSTVPRSRKSGLSGRSCAT